jgi:DNA-directed RNA polymerase specialized sigma24 family protein
VDSDAGYDELPQPYAQALRMRREGRSTEEIAEHLGLEPSVIPSLLALADAKLVRVRQQDT